MHDILIIAGAYLVAVVVQMVLTWMIVKRLLDEWTDKRLQDILQCSNLWMVEHTKQAFEESLANLRVNVVDRRPAQVPALSGGGMPMKPDDGSTPMTVQPEAPRGVRRPLSQEDADALMERLQTFH